MVPTASLHGKVALVTGAGRGIGKGCAIKLGNRGSSIIVSYVNSKSSGDEVVMATEKSGTGAKAISIQADVWKVSDIERLPRRAKNTSAKLTSFLTIVIRYHSLKPRTSPRRSSTMNVILIRVGQAAWKHLEEKGRVILMSSISAGLLGVKHHALYNASKMAVNGMVKAFATDIGTRRVNINGLAPGGTKSDMITQNAWHYIPGGDPTWLADKIVSLLASHCLLGRCAVPEDLARVVAFLASEDGGWVNGESCLVSDLSDLRGTLTHGLGKVITVSGEFP